MKSFYQKPISFAVSVFTEGVMDGVVSQGPDVPPGEGGDAKGNDDLVDDEAELVAPIKDKWEDVSEKKNGK